MLGAIFWVPGGRVWVLGDACGVLIGKFWMLRYQLLGTGLGVLGYQLLSTCFWVLPASPGLPDTHFGLLHAHLSVLSSHFGVPGACFRHRPAPLQVPPDIGYPPLPLEVPPPTPALPILPRTTAFGFLNALCKLAAVLGISIFTSFVGITKAVPILFASAALALGSSLALKLPETRGQVLQ